MILDPVVFLILNKLFKFEENTEKSLLYVIYVISRFKCTPKYFLNISLVQTRVRFGHRYLRTAPELDTINLLFETAYSSQNRKYIDVPEI